MNIFFLHLHPQIAARAMTNKHVVKMILESAQLLSTAHLVCDGVTTVGLSKSGRKQKQFVHHNSNILYKASHINHPSAIWVRESALNYIWLYNHFAELCAEYTRRYKRVHATETKLLNILAYIPYNISASVNFKDPPQAMPDQYKSACCVSAYRNYYESEKLKLDVDIDRYKKYLKFIKFS